MKRSVFLASGLALALAPPSIARAAKVPAVVRVFDGNLVATVPLEQYLYSVVASEMPTSWPAAALQAQAICARTYVLARTNPAKPYDVVPSEANQMYGGIESESPAATAAVDATAGKVLRFGPTIASIAYSSCCGGRTESSADAWGTPALPYLRSTNCPWCTSSPDYRWTRIVNAEDIARAFATGSVSASAPSPHASPSFEPASPSSGPASGAPDLLGAIQNIAVGATDASGRAREIILSGTTGSVHIPASVFRERVGTRIIRSLYIQRIASSQEAFTVDGAGYGHGVGLCQWGAKGMAVANHTAEDILNFYFPGTAISQA